MENILKEFDSSDLAWSIFDLMYKDNIITSNKEDSNKNKRPCCISKFKYKGKETDEKLNFSGDTDFNFKKGFAHSRLETYEKNIDKIYLDDKNKEDKYRNMYLQNLKVLIKLTHSILNISIMPQTGNLQAFKQGIGNDRLDTFIWAINEYYYNGIELLFNYSTFDNVNCLKSYFELFSNVYEYCEVIYHIDEGLVDDLIDLGKQSLNSAEKVIKFMNLAIRFFNQKATYLSTQLTNIKNEELKNKIGNELSTCESTLDILFSSN